jgi:hypothetical protein
MNLYLLTATALTAILGFAHSILGEMKIFRKMSSHSLPLLKGIPMIGTIDAPTKRTLRMTWHMLTALASGVVCILFRLAQIQELSETEEFVAIMIGGAMILMAFISIVVVKGRHISWLAFLAIGACCLAAGFQLA